jgi:protein-tyrosine phosphatase
MTELSANPYWVDTTGLVTMTDGTLSRMAIVPCPSGGRHLAAAVRDLRELGIDILVSLLSGDEMRVLGLEAEERVCREAGVDYIWFPVDDHSIPESMERFRFVVEQLQGDLRAGKGVGAHCFAGIGRSCMLLAGVLCLEGLTADEAFARLSAARGLTVPDTWLQSQWVQHFSESLENSGEPL